MRKSTIIMIGIIYLASIVIISIFGLKSKVYTENIPVTSVVCTNVSDENTEVTFGADGTVQSIRVIMNKTSTPRLKISFQVNPALATNTSVSYIYNKKDSFEFLKDENGKETGWITFSSQTYFTLTIQSNDGQKKSCTFSVLYY